MLVFCGLLLAGRDESVVVRGEEGERVASLPLPESGRFGIAYRHSYYEAPATEHFVAGEEGFRLARISSPHGGVLDYYRLEGEREDRGERVWLDPDEERLYEELPLIATERGRRTLVVGGERLPLYTGDGPRHLTISVERGLPGLGSEAR